MEWSTCSDEYEKLVMRMNKPRVVIDNGANPNATVIEVDSARRQGILLESVQVLTDMNLSIRKAYISSDGSWNMDVFHVTDLNGNKLVDQKIIGYIKKSIETIQYNRTEEQNSLTTLELTGTDRIGLLSEIFAVLNELQCDVVEGRVWTHNGRIASIIRIKHKDSGLTIDDSENVNQIETRLKHVLKGENAFRVSKGATHTERRLHQLMFGDRDYEKKLGSGKSPVVTVQNLEKRGYSVVNVQCKDRAKLVFDVVCTLTDMDYVVFHAAVQTASVNAHLEFYIRHLDGTPISSEPEKQRVIQCLQAAIERRASKGWKLELCTRDKPGLLAEVIRAFRENGIYVTTAEISTKDNRVLNVFYVTDSNGKRVESETIESVRKMIGLSSLNAKQSSPLICRQRNAAKEEQQQRGGGTVFDSLGSLVLKNLYNLGLIRSHS